MISILAVLLLPSFFIFLSSTNSGQSGITDTEKLQECKVSSFLYCNFPIDSQTNSEFWVNKTDLLEEYQTATSKVAELLGSNYDTVFNNDVVFPSKLGGHISVENETYAGIVWYSNSENTAFPKLMINALNDEMELLNSSLRFYSEAPLDWEAGSESAFDLSSFSFVLLFQLVATRITMDKASQMYYYITRMGLSFVAYWTFQYIYYMIIGILSVVLTILFSEITEKDLNMGAYIIAVWFHVSLGILVGSAFKNKSYANLINNVILIVLFVTPMLFAFAFPKTEKVQDIFRIIKMIPLFFTMGSPDTKMLTVGSIITVVVMVLASYLTPLLSVNDGMFESSGRNYLYFLSPLFWTEGIVALPSYSVEEDEKDKNLESTKILQYRNCVKIFRYTSFDPKKKGFSKYLHRIVENKTIGPMNLCLEVGKISTLLGKNGVGKSTFLKVAAGYYIPSEGEIIFENKNIFRSSWSSLKEIGLCPQDNYLLEELTVDEHMKFISSLRDTSKIKDIPSHIDWILTTLDIIDKRSTVAKKLSGGMKRRLCLAMAVLGFPKVLLLDEPSSGVDHINQRGIWKLLETAKKHSAILLTTHSDLEAVILSDEVINMNSSTDITSNSGYKETTFTLKNIIDNSIEEYSLASSSLREIREVLMSLPNDGSEWKIASKRLTGTDLLPLSEIKSSSGDDLNQDEQIIQEDEHHILPPLEIITAQTPSMMQQVKTLLSMTSLHPDRISFIFIMGIPISAGLIWFSTLYSGLSDLNLTILIPLIPLIFIIPLSILLSNAAPILSQDRELGVSKLIFSQGVSRKAYLLSFLMYYAILSLPIPAGTLIYVGLVHGSTGSTIALFIVFISFWFLHLGLGLFLGATLDPRMAFISTCVLPSVFVIFAQGALSETFANSYPGSNGQVMAGLLVDTLTNSEWGLCALSIIVNVFFGLIGMYIFLVKFENYNTVSLNFCARNRCEKNIALPDKQDEENVNYEVGHETFSSDVLLKGCNIEKIYGIGQKDRASFKALDNVTFAIPEGSLLGLVGKSGAGKSTLMEVLSGQISATRGTVHVDGMQVKPSQISKVVSLCSQVDTFWPEIRVIDAIKIFMKFRGYGNESYARNVIKDLYIAHIIDQLNMQEMLKKKVKKLSGGQKRRLAFLVSLMGGTKVVLIDEAMTGVDTETRQIMWHILQKEVLERNRSVVVTTHNISEVEQYCNSVGILHRGKLVEMGLLSEIKKKWRDKVKLVCLLESHDAVSRIEDRLLSRNDLVVDLPLINVLNESSLESEKGKLVATYPIDLKDLQNITSLVSLIEDLDSRQEESSILYWSIEPMNLDDFILESDKAR